MVNGIRIVYHCPEQRVEIVPLIIRFNFTPPSQYSMKIKEEMIIISQS
jgi:hypothetical protein